MKFFSVDMSSYGVRAKTVKESTRIKDGNVPFSYCYTISVLGSFYCMKYTIEMEITS